ncbi:MAG: PocR ligand-binding domain-containing protein [Labilithrix sp.]|nr:PocR ligand-binding domain-containing protein [Labilithrix sp.]
MSEVPPNQDVVGDQPIALEDVVDRDALDDLCKSIHALFGIGVRVYASQGALLANVANELELCRYVNEVPGSRAACGATVIAAKSVAPGDDGEVTHPCFTGLAYHIVSLVHEGRRVGRIVLGPYAPAGLREPPPSLAQADKRLDVARASDLAATVPRVKQEALQRIAGHLKETLELIIFSSHKAWVTSKLHLYSVRESYRELQDKTTRLEQTLTRLKEVDRLKSNFLATMSHELRTPLTSIIGYSEMLAEGIAGELSAEQQEYVRTIHAKGEQLLRLIMGLLDLSKLESGTMSLRQAPAQIGPILKEVITTLAPVARKKEVELALDSDDAPCELAADAERLRQVFINLVDNAVKFTPKGGKVTVRARVTAGAAPSGDDDDDEAAGAALLAPLLKQVEVRVSDTGIGIPAAERVKVFEAFYQVDSSSTREYGGTGLGLSIVKRIVDAHGGQVSVEGNEPNGTVFVVVLPSAQTRRAALPSRVPPALA